MMTRNILALLCAMIPAAAVAQTAPAPQSAPAVTRAQVTAKLDADYANLDSDKNGKASKAEVEKRIATETAAELAALVQRRTESFNKMDGNKDGQISKAEFEIAVPMPKAPPANAAPVLARFDTNKDGVITAAEFRAPTLANFDQLDANKDGTLTAAEQQAARTAPQGR
jgi:Ca2+-binding EF-hand superfamily protein